MFLKVMHDGADEFLSQAQSEATYSLYADVTSCDFKRYPIGNAPTPGHPTAVAHIQCREPVKTAEVPGYAEIEKFIELTGDAFLMNDQGRTISKFILHPFGVIGKPSLEPISGNQQPGDELLLIAKSAEKNQAALDKFYLKLPYLIAVWMKNTALRQRDVALLDDFERLKIAVDA